jgi:hypothetical protein
MLYCPEISYFLPGCRERGGSGLDVSEILKQACFREMQTGQSRSSLKPLLAADGNSHH